MKYKEEKIYYVYISTNIRHTVLYTGITNDLLNRDHQHKTKFNKESFTAKYNINKIVYYEEFGDVYMAIERERQIKNLVRRKKIELIESINPKWEDLVEKYY